MKRIYSLLIYIVFMQYYFLHWQPLIHGQETQALHGTLRLTGHHQEHLQQAILYTFTVLHTIRNLQAT
jgi:hypothetical protein